MGRSVFATINLDDHFKSREKAEAVLTEKGFEKAVCDYEEVWIKENPGTDTVTYLKIEYCYNIFIFSVWIKQKSDEPYREYFVEYFGQNMPNTRVAEDITDCLLNLFPKRFRTKEVLVYE
ncbi:MAG: hypothetical protein IJD88_04365 [Clostridia bacterium]|nr:hypothetical protein [Clostridia bacterium]